MSPFAFAFLIGFLLLNLNTACSNQEILKSPFTGPFLTLPEVMKKMVLSKKISEFIKTHPGHEIKFDRSEKSIWLHSYKFKHFINQIEIIGSGLSYQIGSQGEELQEYLAEIPINTKASISTEEAVLIALAAESATNSGPPSNPPSHDQSSKLKTFLKVFYEANKRKYRLVYYIELDPLKTVVIDANKGTHIATFVDSDSIHHSESKHSKPQTPVYDVKNRGIQVDFKYKSSSENEELNSRGSDFESCHIIYLESNVKKIVNGKDCKEIIIDSCQVINQLGFPVRFQLNKCPLVFDFFPFEKVDSPKNQNKDLSAQRAYENAQLFLKYYSEVHQRLSYDNKGAEIISLIHTGLLYQNASWFKKGKFLIYGEGNGSPQQDYTRAIDISGHELTHAVIQSATGLLSMGESGALNESLSDFFGKLIENKDDWLMGRTLNTNDPSSPALKANLSQNERTRIANLSGFRDLKQPESLVGVYIDGIGERKEKPYPKNRQEMAPIIEPCTKQNDFCSIHFNSTVPGHSWYLIFQEIGKQKTEAVLYLAMTQYMNEATDFQSAAHSVLKACSKLLEQADCDKIKNILLKTELLSL